VGGVSGRAGAKAGGSNPFAFDSFAWRDGERHPGLLEGGTLRGASSERGPWSVRRMQRVSPRSKRRADDSGCPEDAEEGNVVAHAPQSTCTRRRHERSSHALRGRVLHSVLRPVHVNPHYAPGRKPRWWGVRAGITVGQTHASGKNQHWGQQERTERGSSRVTLVARQGRGTLKKRKEVEASVPARIKSPGWVARTS